MVRRSATTRASANHTNRAVSGKPPVETSFVGVDGSCARSAGDPGNTVQPIPPCEAESRAFKAALNSEGSNLGCLLETQSQGIGSTDSMEKGKANVASRSGRSSNSQPQNGRKARSAEQYLAAKKREFMKNVMAVFTKELDKRLAIITYQYESSGASGNACNGGGGRDSDNNDRSGDSSRRSKRHRDGDEQNGSSSGSDGNGRDRRGSNKRVKKEDAAQRGLACPFFKHDPRRYSCDRTCAASGWPTIHRLKEHIYRKHRLSKNACPRCAESFEDKDDLNLHLRSEPLCEIRDPVTAEGVDEQKERKLRERKKSNDCVSEEQRWKEIYLILFPNANRHTMPSPYYESVESVILSSQAAQFKETIEHIRRELPKRFCKKVERNFHQVSTKLLESLNDILRDEMHNVLEHGPQAPAPDSPVPSAVCLKSALPEALSVSANEGVDNGSVVDFAEYFDVDNDGFFPITGLVDMEFTLNPEVIQDMLSCSGVQPSDKVSDSGYASGSTGRERIV